MGLSQQILTCAALAGAALAAPQQLDFAALAAAPTVASGPSAVDADGIQTASLYTAVTVASAVTPSSTATPAVKARDIQVRDTTISSDLTDGSYNGQFGRVGQVSNVKSGVTYWINGGSTHNLFGNIVNYGRIFVSQTKYLQTFKWAGGQTSNWVGHDTNNGNLQNAQGGLIQLNDFGSLSAPSYNWNVRQINNNGTIQWCGRGDTGGSTYQMYSDLDLINNGLISFEQYYNNYGTSFNIRNSVLTTGTSGSNVYNNGAIRIINTNYQQVQNVYGNGCWQIGKNGILYLQDGTGLYQNPTKSSSLSGQSIIFQDSTADLHLDPQVYSKNSNFGAQLYGYASGNAIEFYETINSFSYSSSTGVLTVTMVSKASVNINIGQGYVPSKFYQAKNPSNYNFFGYNAIFYNGAAPSQATPAKCSISAPICSDLSNGLPSSPATTSTLASTTSSTVSLTSSSSTTNIVPTSSVSTSSSPPSATTSSTAVSGGSTPTASNVVTSVCTPTSVSTPAYTPYYAALATSYTTDPALTGTTTAGQACPTTPEDGTYCGFINPLDPCAPQPDGYGPVPTPDTASAFLSYSPLHASASAAPTVVASQCNSQYKQVFQDLNSQVSAQSYLGLYSLQTYDVNMCAAYCDNTNLCTAFNIFAERDPSLNPSKNDSTAATVWGYWCPNPPSMTTYKCTLWGSNIDASLATNQGQWREDFQVVITASNGYDKTNLTVPAVPSVPVSSSVPTGSSAASSAPSSSSSSSAAGSSPTSTTTTSASSAAASSAAPTSTVSPTSPWGNGHNCNGKAIDAGQYWMGSRFFPGPYNPQVCSDYAIKQNNVNQQAAQGSSSYSKCKMFNAYYLNKNGAPSGTYCSLYSTHLDDSWATFASGQSGNDNYQCKQSWTWTLQ